MKVSDLMSTYAVVVYGATTVQKLSEEMARSNHGLAVVLNSIDEKKVIGVVSNKDIINKVVSKKKSPDDFLVKDIMSKEVVSISPDSTASDAMSKIIKNGVKRLVVIENDSLQGIISSNDIVKGMIRRKKELLDLAIDF